MGVFNFSLKQKILNYTFIVIILSLLFSNKMKIILKYASTKKSCHKKQIIKSLKKIL